MHPSEIWNGKSLGAVATRAALLPLSVLYGLGWEVYLAVYRLGLKKPASPHDPVVCVGNLISGGGGKSPVTLHIAEVISSWGRPVVIGASGYGSPHAEAAAVAPSGALDPREWGDEPTMIRERLPDIPLIVGRRRVLAAELCQQHFPDAVLLMDDGFQHLPVKKHLTIVLDPAKPTNCLCLPAGPYREPRWNRMRADIVIPGRFHVQSSPLTFTTPNGEPVTVSKCSVLCAIARPYLFIEDLKSAGIEVGLARALPDHDPLDGGTLLQDMPLDQPVVVTAKDWVKLKALRQDLYRFVIANQSIKIEPAEEFSHVLRSTLG